MMSQVLLLIDKLNISKVSLANYLGVSRQMIYNYLSYDSIDYWPVDKRIKIMDLFDVNNTEELDDLKITNELLHHISKKLNNISDETIAIKLEDLSKKEEHILLDVLSMLRSDESMLKGNFETMLAFIETAQLSTEFAYLIEYLAKCISKKDLQEFVYNEKEQMAFEAIIYSAFQLYRSDQYSKKKINLLHEQFREDQKLKNLALSQETNTLNLAKVIALRELGYEDVTTSNIDEVLKKMAEVRTRKE